VRPLAEDLAARGVAVVFVGNGALRWARAFDEEFALTAAGAMVVTDPTRASYRAAGLARSMWRTLGPRALASSLRMRVRGFRQVGLHGDPWQQGGTLVVARGGHVVYRHANAHTGDHAPVADVRAAVNEAMERSGR
jgi:hypothetical protein